MACGRAPLDDDDIGLELSTVTGTIRIHGQARRVRRANVHITLIDTTEIDAASKTIREIVLWNVDWSALSGKGVAFRLVAPVLEPRNTYEVSVLVDCDGDGRPSLGDFCTKQSYPVLTRGSPNHVAVEVHEVT
jgi:hypothetical protein